MLHWGFNAWAIYAIMALILAYFSYRRGLPLTLRSAFYPLIGDRIYGPLGASIDVFAVVCTTFGISTSLGLGVIQLSAGLEASSIFDRWESHQAFVDCRHYGDGRRVRGAWFRQWH